MRGFASVTLASCLAFAAPACAQELSGDLRVGGGYDSNPALAVDPSNRRLPEDSATPGGSGLFALDGWILGGIAGDGFGARARFDLTGRVYRNGDLRFAERLSAEVSYTFEPLTVRCGGRGGRLDLTLSDDDSWAARGGCGLALRVEGFFGSGDVFGGVRVFDAGQTDALYGGELAVGWASENLRVALGFDLTRRQSDAAVAARLDLSPWVQLAFRWEILGLDLSYRWVVREFVIESRNGAEHLGAASAWLMPLEWLGGYVTLRLGYGDGSPQALRYERIEVVAGIRLALDVRSDIPAEEPAGPVSVDGRRVRFRFEIPGAREVAVIGDFNGWDPGLGALHRTTGDTFEGTLGAPPGRHVYQLLVDGEPTPPPGETRLAEDDFGARNGVFLVP